MSLRPEVIVFDLGKVLLDFDYGITARQLAPFCREPERVISAAINQTELLFRYERGELDTAAFFDEFRRATGYQGSFAQFRQAFGGIFSPIPAMVDWWRKLAAKGYRTWIFSNTNELAIEHIRQTFPFFSGFEGHVLSYEVRCMKPDSRIYEALEQRTGCRGEAILYLDDRQENVSAGLARGWAARCHENPDRTIGELGFLLA